MFFVACRNRDRMRVGPADGSPMPPRKPKPHGHAIPCRVNVTAYAGDM